MHYILYKTTNLVNGKYYIGVHKTENLDDGYLGSGRRLSNAIKKYGKHNFSREILEHLDSEESMYAREREVVNDSFISLDSTYNLTVGGKGGGKKTGKFPVRLDDGKIQMMTKEEASIQGLKHITSGTKCALLKNGDIIRIPCDASFTQQNSC